MIFIAAQYYFQNITDMRATGIHNQASFSVGREKLRDASERTTRSTSSSTDGPWGNHFRISRARIA